jgi:NADPH2:quinone reductase
MPEITRVSVASFGGPESLQVKKVAMASRSSRKVRVRVTHASLGSTDALARQGGYLLQPTPGFIPGYDFVGVIDSGSAEAAKAGWLPGTRVAGCLPRMGSNRTLIDVNAALLVAVPDELPSAVAAALPLDLVTAGLAIALASPIPSPAVLVQGVSGAVGSLIAQHFVRLGVAVLGTASARTRSFAESLGADVLDYRDETWLEQVRSLRPAGLGAVFDHTGDRRLKQITARNGTVVRLAFVGRRGRERLDTFLGGAAASGQYFGHPRVRVGSVPLLVATQPGRYREILSSQLNRIVTGELRAPRIREIALNEVSRAHRELLDVEAGEKIVLNL